MPIPPPQNRIWFVFNRMPGGQMTAMHLEDDIRVRKVGDSQEEIIFTSKDQLNAFKKGKEVMLNIGGKILKNDVLVYGGSAISVRNKRAANVALDWARSTGMLPIYPPDQKTTLSEAHSDKINNLEVRVGNMENNIAELLEIARSK